MAANNFQYTSTVVLASGQNADSKHVDVAGAKGVAWTVKCDKTDQLTAASPQVQYTDGRQATLTPGAFPNGTDSSTLPLNAAGVIITLDLTTATPRLVTLRSTSNTSFLITDHLWGVESAWITLTKAATAGNATYTVVTTVYF